MPGLASPSALFSDKKGKILQQLAVPDTEYEDASPKGSIDVGIRHLIDEINCAEGFVTTSSCAGRVSIFLEGRKSKAEAAELVSIAGDADERQQQQQQVAGVGGKGGGGMWLYVSHEPEEHEDKVLREWMELFESTETPNVACGGSTSGNYSKDSSSQERRLIHFKFEPMILHVLTTSLEHSQLLLRCALQAGFRESGAVNLTSAGDHHHPATPMVAIRSMGLSLESLIGYQDGDGHRQRIVSPEFLQMLISIAGERFVENTKRIERFRSAFRDALVSAAKGAGAGRKMNPEGKEWEDAGERRERMRLEGLRRKAAQAAVKAEEESRREASEGDEREQTFA